MNYELSQPAIDETITGGYSPTLLFPTGEEKLYEL